MTRTVRMLRWTARYVTRGARGRAVHPQHFLSFAGGLLVALAASAAQAQSRTAGEATASESSAANANPAAHLLRNIMAEDPGGQLEGEPVTLLDVLKTSRDRREQLQAVRQYWELASAVGRYHTQLVAYRLLGDLAAGDRRGDQDNSDNRRRSANSSELRPQLDDAQARVEQARAAAVDHQRKLAQSIGRTGRQPLPLPGDLQHTNVYHTRYAEIFANRAAPAAAVLMQRLLPHYQRAVALRTTAVTAAEDAWDALRDGALAGDFDADSALDAWARLVNGQQAFLAVIGEYNSAIAEYALAVAPNTATDAELRGMMIRTAETSTNSLWRQGEENEPRRDGRAAPARYEDWPSNRPAGRASSWDEPAVEYEDAAATYPSAELDDDRVPRRLEAPGRLRPLPPPEKGPDDSYLTPAEETTDRRALRPPYDASARYDSYPRYDERQASALDRRRDLRVAQAPDDGREAPAFNGEHLPVAAAPLRLSSLVDLPPYRRSQRLAVLLCSDEKTAENLGSPLDLEACLQRSSPQQRREAVAAYWFARQALSEWQEHRRLLGRMETLRRDGLASRSSQTGPTVALVVEAARAAARAEAAWAEARWIGAQYQLTQLVGGDLQRPWVWPTTAPHGGRYVTESAGRNSRGAEALQQLDRALAAAALDVVDGAEQLSRRETQRAAGPAELQALLAAFEQQSEQARQFLDEVTRYNVAIADYALGVLSDRADAAQLASALVVTRPGRP